MIEQTRAGNRRPKAYKNESFLDSADARPLRILSEYLEPLAHFRKHRIRDTIVFWGSARLAEDGPMGRYYREARELARLITEWSDSLENSSRRFVVCTGGGPGIMEAANRGAHDAGGKTVGLNIGLPLEQYPNPYVSPELSFEFHYFFMRKFWFGTLDELSELLTLAQTEKLAKKIIIVLYGSTYWNEVLNFNAMVRYGMISPQDLDLFQYADDPRQALGILQEGLTRYYLKPEAPLPEPELETPAIAKSRV